MLERKEQHAKRGSRPVAAVQLGEPQVYKHIAVVPVIAVVDGTFQYRALGEALGTRELTITEVCQAGSVPELLAVNRGDSPVLLIDGEEVSGAKQNRVLNSSILLKPQSETRIPVSCTEQGRWSYSSAEFSESGHVMACLARVAKSSSVTDSLRDHGRRDSNQGAVWSEIAHLHAASGSRSPTSAMSDVYKAWEENLRACTETFKVVPGQVGLVAFIGGEPVGTDLVSLAGAYAQLHPKLVRSYTLGGLFEARDAPAASDGMAGKARQFLEEISQTEEREFPSVGLGTDRRFKGTTFCGAALVHEAEVIHAACFRLNTAGKTERMASLLARRRHFTG